VGLIVIERTESASRIPARRLDLEDLGPGSGQEFTAELAFLVGEFEDFYIEEESRHKFSAEL